MLRFLLALLIPFGVSMWLFTRPWGLLETIAVLLGLALVYPLLMIGFGPGRSGGRR